MSINRREFVGISALAIGDLLIGESAVLARTYDPDYRIYGGSYSLDDYENRTTFRRNDLVRELLDHVSSSLEVVVCTSLEKWKKYLTGLGNHGHVIAFNHADRNLVGVYETFLLQEYQEVLEHEILHQILHTERVARRDYRGRPLLVSDFEKMLPGISTSRQQSLVDYVYHFHRGYVAAISPEYRLDFPEGVIRTPERIKVQALEEAFAWYYSSSSYLEYETIPTRRELTQAEREFFGANIQRTYRLTRTYHREASRAEHLGFRRFYQSALKIPTPKAMD